MDGLTLLIPQKADIERDAVADAWQHRGGEVARIGRFWDPPAFDPGTIRVYGNETFCLVLQQKLNLELITPPDELILSLSPNCLRRWLAPRVLAEADELIYPVFAKPLVPKLFAAGIYSSAAELEAECSGLAPDTAILTSEIVEFTAEARCFVHDGRVLDCAFYEGEGDVAAAQAAAQQIASAVSGIVTYVLDVGLIPARGWAAIEFNATWGAGLNGCGAQRVLPAIATASNSAS